jgi:hypothetical protein
MAHCTDLLRVSGGKATRNAGRNPIVSKEKRASSMTGLRLTLQVGSENIWLPPLDWTGQANGLASHATRPYTNGFLPIGPH